MNTIVTSDIHIGDHRYNTEPIIKALKSENFDRLILNGDIIDIWVNDIDNIKQNSLVYFIKEIAKNKDVYWVLGNHDIKSDLFGENVKIVDSLEFTYKDSKFLVVHGNEVYPNKNNSKCNRFLANVNSKLHKWFNIDLQTSFRKTSLYRNKSRKMRTKLLNKYDGMYNYIIMGHTHQMDHVRSSKTDLLDIGCPHISKTYMLIQDEHIYLRRIDDK